MTRPCTVLAGALALLLCLAGCSGRDAVSMREKHPSELVGIFAETPDSISPAALTADQRELLELLESTGLNLYLMEFETQAEYKRMDVWVEVYRGGELVEARVASLSQVSDEPGGMKGRLVLDVGESPWSFTLISDRDNGGKATCTGESRIDIDAPARTWSSLTAPVEIVSGEEIVLYASLFFDSDTFASYDLHEYTENPDRLKEAAYAHLVKCKFS